jgi:hypothetical protein
MMRATNILSERQHVHMQVDATPKVAKCQAEWEANNRSAKNTIL